MECTSLNNQCPTVFSGAKDYCYSNTCSADQCLANSDCTTAPNTKCLTSAEPNACVECLGNSDCSTNALEPICDVASTNTCKGCASNTECSTKNSALPVCLGTGQCVECDTDADCTVAGKPICSASKTCVACSTDSECSTKNSLFPVCNSGPCVECTSLNNPCSTLHSGAKNYCLSNTCSADQVSSYTEIFLFYCF